MEFSHLRMCGSDDETIFAAAFSLCVYGSVTRSAITKNSFHRLYDRQFIHENLSSTARNHVADFSSFFVVLFIFVFFSLSFFRSFHLKHFLRLIGALFLLPRAIRTLYTANRQMDWAFILNAYALARCTGCKSISYQLDVIVRSSARVQ